MRYFGLVALLVLYCGSRVGAAAVRSIDGKNNNANNPNWGSYGTPFTRTQADMSYADGLSQPFTDRPSARWISNVAMGKAKPMANEEHVPDMLAFWGQFVTHDVVHVNNDNSDPFDIDVPIGDPVFDPTGTGVEKIRFPRLESTTDPVTNKRVIKNYQTSWLDGSMVYGAEEARAKMLRTMKGGLFRTYKDKYLPISPSTPPDLMLGLSNWTFLAGDYRANENPALLSLHTLFMREHNRKAKYYASKFPNADDETLYHMARNWTIACIQKITYNEYLPKLLGGPLPTYEGHDPTVDPGIDAVFFTSAMRYGHSAINPIILRLDDNWDPIPAGHLVVRDAITNPLPVLEEGIEPVLRGIVAQLEQKTDMVVVNDLRSFMPAAPFRVGPPLIFFDLAAFNIQRGRDVGVPTYNEVRKHMGLTEALTFADITTDTSVQQLLSDAYGGNISIVDPYVGGLAEDVEKPSILGPLFKLSITEQFTRIRDGDAFWYERDGILTPEDKADLANVTLSNIILWNTDITSFPSSSFTYASTATINSLRGVSLGSGNSTNILGSIEQRVQLVDGLALTYHINTGLEMVDMKLESNHTGWFAIGIGGSMSDSDIMAVYQDGDVWTVNDFRSTAYSTPATDISLGCTNDLVNVTDVTSTTSSIRAFAWSRKLSTGDSCDKDIVQGQSSIMFAYSDSSTTLIYHGQNKENGALNFFSGVGASTSTTSGSLISGLTGTHLSDLFVILHAIEMMAILFIFVPLGIYIARYGTRVDLWLPWHKWLMSLALGEFAFTLRTIFTQMTTFGSELGGFTHVKLGIVIACLGIIIGACGYIAQSDFRVFAKISYHLRKIHQFGGMIVFILGVFNGWLGVQDFAARFGSTDTLWPILYIAYFAALFLMFFSFPLYWKRMLRVIMRKSANWMEDQTKPGESTGRGTVKFMDASEIKEPEQEMSLEHFKQSCAAGQSWTIISGMVIDVIKYAEQHPGGKAALRAAVGKDATRMFQGKEKPKRPDADDIRMHGHSRFAMNKASEFVIAKIREQDLPSSKSSAGVSRASRFTLSTGGATRDLEGGSANPRRPSMLHTPRDAEGGYGTRRCSLGPFPRPKDNTNTPPRQPNSVRRLSLSGPPSDLGFNMDKDKKDTHGISPDVITEAPHQAKFNGGEPILGSPLPKPENPLSTAGAQRNFHFDVLSSPINEESSRGLEILDERYAILVEKQTVTGYRAVNPIKKLRFSFEDDGVVNIVPGDAVTITMPTKTGIPIHRQYTPVRCLMTGYFDLYIKIYRSGILTPLIDNLEVGSRIAVKGPKQHLAQSLLAGSRLDGCYDHLIMLAAGTGVTPMMQLIDYYVIHAERSPNGALSSQLHLVWSNRSEDDLFLTTELAAAEKSCGGSLKIVHLLTNPSAEWKGRTSRITVEILKEQLPETLRKLISAAQEQLNASRFDDEEAIIGQSEGEAAPMEIEYHWSTLSVVVCGPPGYNEACIGILNGLGIPEDVVHVL